jgi:hypothetical protein
MDHSDSESDRSLISSDAEDADDVPLDKEERSIASEDLEESDIEDMLPEEYQQCDKAGYQSTTFFTDSYSWRPPRTLFGA